MTLPHIESPWALEDMTDGGMVRADDPNRPGKRFLICVLGPTHRSKADAELAAGHGLLIKAAPAMLRALRALNAEVEKYAMAKDIGHEGSMLLEAISDARAAIALATEWQEQIEP